MALCYHQRHRHKYYLAQSDDTLLGSHTATLDHDEVIVNFTIVDKTTHGGDSLVSQIVLGGGVVLDNLTV